MVKVLSQAGISLADTYDVEGSIAGVEQLMANDIVLVHEMGATIFSERLSGGFNRIVSGALAQNLTFDVEQADMGAVPSRIMGLCVFVDTAARLDHVTVLVRSPRDDREIPIFAWDSNEDVLSARIRDNGGAAAAVVMLTNGGDIGTLPSMLIGDDQPAPVSEIALRGLTSGFGAGVVNVTAVIYRAFAQVGGISSHGLPVPGW